VFLALLVAGWVVGVNGVAAAPQQAPAAADVDVETVRYPSGSASIDAYVARPRGGGKHGAVLVVHDDLGLNDAVRGVTRLFARAGFVALAPNLLSRSSGASMPGDRGRGGGGGEGGFGRRTPVMGLPLPQTVADVEAAFTFLQQHADVDAAKISAIGLGWGGYRVWRLAQDTPALYRAVVFYGVPPTDDQLTKINAPVLAHYAQYDFLRTASALKTQKRLGKKFTYYIYPAERGFFGGGSGAAIDITALAGEVVLLGSNAPRPTSGAPAPGNAGAAKLALERTLAFLRS
jgi:carboxymethylenebutenolidase